MTLNHIYMNAIYIILIPTIKVSLTIESSTSLFTILTYGVFDV